jgi:type IV pilus assembly protein PilV
MQLRHRVFGKSATGFTLLEVLVALVVLSIGLLGLSGLQTSSLRNNHSAFLRSQATLAITDIMDRIRANSDAANAGDYDIAYDDSASETNCTSGCSPEAVADTDLFEWRSYVERLPDGEGEIDVNANGVAEVKVRWADARDSGNKLEIITRSQI